MLSTVLADFIGRGIAHIMDRVVVFLLIERNLEGQDRVELVDVALDTLDAVFFPSPYLG